MKIVIELDESDKKNIEDSVYDLIYDIHGKSLTDDQFREAVCNSIKKLLESINLQEKTTEMVDRMFFEVNLEFNKKFSSIYNNLTESFKKINGLQGKRRLDS